MRKAGRSLPAAAGKAPSMAVRATGASATAPSRPALARPRSSRAGSTACARPAAYSGRRLEVETCTSLAATTDAGWATATTDLGRALWYGRA